MEKKPGIIRNTKAQALVEAAIVIPMLLMLLIGTIYFGSLMYNQQRAYMASRHGAWLKTKAGARDIDNGVKAFFADPDNVIEVRSEPVRFQTGIRLVDSILSILPVMEDNYKVKVTYRQPGMPYAAPVYLNPQDELVFSFQDSVTLQAECTMPSRNTWKSTSQILKSILGI